MFGAYVRFKGNYVALNLPIIRSNTYSLNSGGLLETPLTQRSDCNLFVQSPTDECKYYILNLFLDILVNATIKRVIIQIQAGDWENFKLQYLCAMRWAARGDCLHVCVLIHIK